jgi:hypothetical protein
LIEYLFYTSGMDDGAGEATATVDGAGAAHGGAGAAAVVDPLALVTALLDSTEVFNRSVAMSQAAQLAAIREAILTAKRNPEIYVRPDTSDRHGRAVELATRAIVMELSMRLNLPEGTIWSEYHEADSLMTRLPKLWGLFCAGTVSYRNVREAAQTAWSLPHDNPRMDAALDETLTGKAELTPSQFRKAARAARERLHPEDATQRHVEARAGRTVDRTQGDDGMAWWGLWTDAVTVAKIDARVDARAAKQSQVEGETRTLAQLRADAAADLLTGAGTAWEVKAHVHLDVPATILLDQPDLLKKARTNRAVLEGYGPIDDETARRLLADAPSFRRIFTDPITGAILNMDRDTYRPTRVQREWLRRQYPDGGSPTRAIRVENADLDHTTDWDFTGVTNVDNLVPLARAHHTLKHKTKLGYTRTAQGRIRWRSPTGYERDTYPPPF